MRINTLRSYYIFSALVADILFFSDATSQSDLSQISEDRKTKTVQIINDILPSVAAIQTFKESETDGIYNLQVGSASVIHEDGYLLTNEHVVSGMVQGNAILYNSQPKQFKVIASMASEDLAIIKINSDKKLKPVPIGRSNDLLLGEPVITIGNPGGLNHSISTGIISGLNRSTSTGSTFLPWMIQTSAAVSGGNSGGPLINALGQQIGTITSKQLGSENINFAISIDRIREVLPNLLSPELRYGFWLGIEIQMLSDQVVVKSIKDNSPASDSKFITGDVIKSVNGTQISHPFDFYFSLISLKQNQKISMTILRENSPNDLEVTLGELKLIDPIETIEVTQGISYKLYEGQWDKLPDFNKLKSSSSGVANTISANIESNDINEHYGLVFDGFLKINEEGLYTFNLSSDDGSQLIIGDNVLINNDGLHANISLEGRTRLKKGLIPIKILYFENSGDQKLELRYEGPGIRMQPIAENLLFSTPTK